VDLSIIILNYNGRSWLEKLLPSLRAHFLTKTQWETEVVVVDNASTDDSVAWLEAIPWIRLIRSAYNGGFARGNNLAIHGNNARYLMLLNSDTELLPDRSNLDLLIDYMDQCPEIGIITPKIILDNNHLDPACHRGEPTPWAAFTYFMGLEKLFYRNQFFGQYHQTEKPLTTIHDIDACTGAALMVRTAGLSRVGLLDERFFMYAEDLDWCKRFREAGFRIVFHPAVTIRHHKYQSGIRNTDHTLQQSTSYWFYTTMLQYYDKYYKDKYPRIFRFLLKAVLFFSKRKKPSSDRFQP
jgi:GT2 family glycosyltransferase